MSRTKKHVIEGRYHHGIIPLSDVPRSVMNGWDRKNAMSFPHKTGAHEKSERLNKIIISDLNEINKEIV